MANPFKPGHDPRRNLKGRGKGGINLTDLVRKIGEEPVSKEDRRRKIDAIMRTAYEMALARDLKAIEFLACRGWGQPVIPIESTGNGPLVTIIQEKSPA